MTRVPSIALFLSLAVGCGETNGTGPPPGGWANTAPTVVEAVVDRGERQLLSVRQGELQTWIGVPDVDVEVGDYVLLGQGTPREDVEIPELDERVPMVVDIPHVQVVDESTARQAAASRAPSDAVAIGTIYAEREERAGQEVVVYGTVVKSASAIGWHWVHLRDGTGDAAAGTNDLTVKTTESVAVGRRVAFRGTLRSDVDLGFGYHYDALIEEGQRLE